MRYSRAVAYAVFAYGALWSAISLLRYYSFTASVFDLGVAMGYVTYATSSLSLHRLVAVVALKPIVYLVAPIAYAFSFQGMLVFQSFFLGLGAYPIYRIAERSLQSERLAFLLAISYLLYFPLAGVNWFDFHYQALFPTLFLFGYLFYVERRELLSLVFMILSGMVHYPYTVFPLMFALMLMIGKNRRRDIKIWLPLLLVASAIIALNVALYGVFGATFGTVSAPLQRPTLSQVVLTVLMAFLPLSFIFVISRWAFFLIPFLALISTTHYAYYVYPLVFRSQYGALYIPFVFLGTIEGIGTLERRKIADKGRATAVVFLGVLIFASIYQPYSPLNAYTSVNYGFSRILNVNLTQYDQLMKLLSLIPPGSKVLIPENVPEAFYPYFKLQPYSNGYTNPELVFNHTIQYIVVGPYGEAYYSIPPHPMIPMNELVVNASEMGYGIYAEAYGMMVLKYNYTGPPVYYYPLREYFPSSGFIPTAPWFLKNGLITATDVMGEQLWYGPELLLPPGNYTIIVFVKTTSFSKDNWMGIAVYANYQTELITVYYLNGASLRPGWNQVKISFEVPRIYENEEVVGYAYNWTGTLWVRGIYINQTSCI